MDNPDGMTRGEAFAYLDRHGLTWGGTARLLDRARAAGREVLPGSGTEIVCRGVRYHVLLGAAAVNSAAVFTSPAGPDEQPCVTLGGVDVFVWRQEDGSLGINVCRDRAQPQAWPIDTTAGYEPRPAGTPVPVVLYDDSTLVAAWDPGPPGTLPGPAVTDARHVPDFTTVRPGCGMTWGYEGLNGGGHQVFTCPARCHTIITSRTADSHGAACEPGCGDPHGTIRASHYGPRT